MTGARSDELIAQLTAAHEQAVMVGWDFSALADRVMADDPGWDFESDCLHAMGEAARIVDLGTGGGERLLRLLADLPDGAQARQVQATEGWAPNLELARERLAQAGVEVRAYDAERGDPMPFESGALDLIMARHEAIDACEIARVLAPGGRLLTQQVDGRDAPELREWFGGESQYPHVQAENYVKALQSAGLQVDVVDEWAGMMRFSDVPALVTYLGFVPWDVPDFTVAKHAEKLRSLAAAVPISVTQRRFRIYASKD